MNLRTFIARIMVVLAAVAASSASAAGAEISPGNDGQNRKIPIIVEDFESYASDQDLAKAWYRPPHGNWVRQSREEKIRNSGWYSLKIEYRTEPGKGKDYAAVCRVHPWNMDGADAARFWLKPDGSGRHLTFEMNIADAAGKNIHDLWSVTLEFEKGDSEPRIVTVPFSRLKQNSLYADSPNVSPVFKAADVIEIAFYIGVSEGRYGDGVFYIDDIQAVRLEDEAKSPSASSCGFDEAADNALRAMVKCAEGLRIHGVAVVAFFEGDSIRSWSSKMAVVGTMKNAPTKDNRGDNLLAIAYSKASEMAETLKHSGTAGRPPMTGEFGWQGGLILKGGLVPGGKSGTWITAFSGGPSEDDVKVSRAGVDALVGN